MIKKIFRLTIAVIIISAGIWFLTNVDIDSVCTTTVDSIKYEFTPQNIQRGLEAFQEAVERKLK